MEDERNASNDALWQRIEGRLRAAGWNHGMTTSRFIDEKVMRSSAVMEFAGEMDLRVVYYGDIGVTFTMETEPGHGITIIMKCPEAIDDVLSVITSAQSEISEETFRDHIATLVGICPDIYADLGEDGVVRLDNNAPRQH